MRFDNLDELRQKVSGSICMVDDEGPYYVLDFTKSSIVVLDENGEKVLEKNPKRASYRTPVLGNIQHLKGAFYVSRAPVRRYKVGLSPENCVPKDLFRTIPSGWICAGLKETRMNMYKYQYEYKKMVAAGYVVALSKRYSISSKQVKYRGDKIADVVGSRLVFNSEEELEFHSSNLMSLIQDFTYEVKEKEKELKYGQDDI